MVIKGVPKLNYFYVELRIGLAFLAFGILSFNLLNYENRLWDKIVITVAGILLVGVGLSFLIPSDD